VKFARKKYRYPFSIARYELRRWLTAMIVARIPT